MNGTGKWLMQKIISLNIKLTHKINLNLTSLFAYNRINTFNPHNKKI